MIHKNWAELIKPTQLEVKPGNDPTRVATVIAEPLERGFGLTLGNALRRVLLSSLRGAAVTAVQIDGVLHEFSSIAGVREDVTDIVLNIKEIAIRMEGDGPKRMVVRKQGPGVVTAGDIQTVGDAVKDLLAADRIDVPPCRKRLLRGLCGGVDIVRAAFRDLADKALVNGRLIVESRT